MEKGELRLMALTGLEIYKQLPKKNCGECGVPTCLAFAMALAAGKAALASCPYVSDAAKEMLDSASAPPIKKIAFGAGVELGDETVMFRHDKTFFHPTAVTVKVADTLSLEEIAAKVAEINDLQFDRVGLHYTVDAVAVVNESGDAAKFAAAVAAVAGATELALVLLTSDAAALKAALEPVAARKPLVGSADASNYETMVEIAKSANVPLIVKGEGLDSLAELVEKISAMGYKELVLDPGSRETSKVLADLTNIRRLAIKKKFRPFGYPVVAFTTSENPLEEVVQAGVYVAKYASAVVVNAVQKAHILPLLTWRQNVYTDPQKPIQVEPNLHAVGDVTPDSPVYVTTNFSLTYYTVQGEIETSKIPSYILAVDTDGTSVLTAYAAGKLEPEKVAELLEKFDVANKVNHKKVVIPGYVAVISGKLKEKSGWDVVVGPREASGIVSFAKANFAS
jgi:acetyl-CoA decarbonylase/synthase, CODH/ACS complex subunit gamma